MKHRASYLSLLIYCYIVIDPVASLRVTEISIPKHIDIHEKARLSCKFEITRGKLYSVKWYKDEFEFFRYMPDNVPQITTFPVPGVYLDLSQSSMTTVTLKELDFSSSGNYRCEVSKDGPNFETVVRNGNMTVMAYPKDNPIITGIRREYGVGDYLSGNCTSNKTNPVAELSWFINKRQADVWQLEKYPVISEEGLLYTRVLGIHFRIEKSHFQSNRIELRCTARMADLPAWERVLNVLPETSMDGIHAQTRLNNGLALTKNHFTNVIGLFVLLLLFT